MAKSMKAMKSSSAKVMKKVATKATKKKQKTTDEGKPKKAMKQASSSSMTLEEKLKMWREKNDISADLDLNHEQQKQLSSKFLNALKSAPDDAKSQYSAVSTLPGGQKTKSKQALVKAWILDNKWGENFLHYTKTLNFGMTSTKTEKPLTRMELEAKYSEEELNALLESGGISEVSHSGNARVKLYVDHGMWEKSKTLTKNRTLVRKQVKTEDDEEALEDWDKVFNGVSLDVDQAENLFMKDCTSLIKAKDPENPENEKKKKKSLTNLDDLEDEDCRRLISQASNVLNAKVDTFTSLLESLKKNSHYSAALKKTSETMKKKLGELLDKTKFYNVKGGSVQMITSHLKEVMEYIKEVQQHSLLLKKL